MAITAPEKDAQGRALPHDHPELAGDGRVIRRVSSHHVVPSSKGPRISSAILDPSTKDVDPYCGLSVDLEQLLLAENVDALEHIKKGQTVGALAFKVSSFRDQRFYVGWDPQPENNYHGAVWERPANGGKFTRGTKKRLLREAEWFLAIEGVAIAPE